MSLIRYESPECPTECDDASAAMMVCPSESSNCTMLLDVFTNDVSDPSCKPHCSCFVGFIGAKCEYAIADQLNMDVIKAVIAIVILLIIISVVAWYSCRKYRQNRDTIKGELDSCPTRYRYNNDAYIKKHKLPKPAKPTLLPDLENLESSLSIDSRRRSGEYEHEKLERAGIIPKSPPAAAYGIPYSTTLPRITVSTPKQNQVTYMTMKPSRRNANQIVMTSAKELANRERCRKAGVKVASYSKDNKALDLEMVLNRMDSNPSAGNSVGLTTNMEMFD